MEITYFEVGNGWGYTMAGISQEYDPDLEGFIEMTRERAEVCALLVASRVLQQ